MHSPSTNPARVAALVGLITAASGLTGCGTSNLVTPVGAGMTRVSFSMGGPIVTGQPVPTPLTNIGVAHGLSDAIDVHGGLYPTVAAYGIGGLDLGAAWHVVPGNRKLLTLGVAGYGFINSEDYVTYADPWIGTAIEANDEITIGLGFHSTFRLATSSSSIRDNPFWAPTPFVLVGYRPGGKLVELQLETRWYAPNECGNCGVITYASPGGFGAIGVLLGATYDFGNGKR